MNTVDVPSLLTIMFVLVDDWYQEFGHQLVPSMPGPQLTFSDSEMMTLLLAMDYFPFPGETQFLGFIRANYLCLFPKLLDQSQFNRRARRLEGLLEELRRFWVRQMGYHFERTLVMDTKRAYPWDVGGVCPIKKGTRDNRPVPIKNIVS
jgi:hypothetical protein